MSAASVGNISASNHLFLSLSDCLYSNTSLFKHIMNSRLFVGRSSLSDP